MIHTGGSGRKAMEAVILSQGVYYALTGIWPIADIASFMQVTGPKNDIWLVRMVGLLALSTGVCLLYCRLMRAYPPLLRILAITNIVSFVTIDVAYALGDVISPVYLADAVLQVLPIPAYFIWWQSLPVTFSGDRLA